MVLRHSSLQQVSANIRAGKDFQEHLLGTPHVTAGATEAQMGTWPPPPGNEGHCVNLRPAGDGFLYLGGGANRKLWEAGSMGWGV